LGMLTEVPATRHFTISWKRSMFAALATAVHPNAKAFLGLPFVAVDPGGAYRTTSLQPELVSVQFPATTGADVVFDLDYGNRFPPEWAEFTILETSFSLAYPGNLSGFGSASVFGPPQLLAAIPVEPLVGPPRDLRLEGQDAQANLTGLGTTPTLSWSPPSIGTVSRYLVDIRHLSGGLTMSDVVAWIYTAETSTPIPPGLLVPGQTYSIAVYAEAGSPTAMAHPLLVDSAVVGATASALTGLITP